MFTGRIFTHAAIHRRNLGNTRVLFDAILHHYGFTNITDRRVREFRAIIFHSTACHKSFHNVAPVYITRRLLVASTTMRILLFETGKKIRLFSSLSPNGIFYSAAEILPKQRQTFARSHTHTHIHTCGSLYTKTLPLYIITIEYPRGLLTQLGRFFLSSFFRSTHPADLRARSSRFFSKM